MEEEQRKDTVKERYEKPNLKIIDLAAEEVLAYPCNQRNGTARLSYSCKIFNPCTGKATS